MWYSFFIYMFVFSVLCPPEERGLWEGAGEPKNLWFFGRAKSIMVNVGPGCVKITPKNPFVSSPSDPFFLSFFFFSLPSRPPSGVGLSVGRGFFFFVSGCWVFFLLGLLLWWELCKFSVSRRRWWISRVLI